jgi:hypothetical protein
MLITLRLLFANLKKLPVESVRRGYLCQRDNKCAGVVVISKHSCYGEKEKAEEDFYS